MKKAKIIAVISFAAVITIFITARFYPVLKGLAGEQVGESPDSGAASRIKETYDHLVAEGLGFEGAGSWGDWGAMWNRIRSSAGSAVDYQSQSLAEYDDYKYSDEHGAGESDGEESVWNNTAPNVWKDERTGLYWSATQGQFTNSFNANHSLCPFFAENPRGSSYDGSDADCGNAINACAVLSLDADGDGVDETDWYLPSQKELQQAYLDGIYNQAGHPFTGTSFFWSSTELSGSTSNAWLVALHDGNTRNVNKSTSYVVRCVRRD